MPSLLHSPPGKAVELIFLTLPSPFWLQNEPIMMMLIFTKQHYLFDPSQDSSIGSISAWYRESPGFKARQGREFFSENN